MSAVNQVIIEVLRCKLSRSISISASGKVQVFGEGTFGRNKNKRVFKTKTSKVYSGCILCVPWSKDLRKIALHFSLADDNVIYDVGIAVWDMVAVPVLVTASEITMFVTASNGRIQIGRIVCRVIRQDIFCSDATTPEAQFKLHKNVLEEEVKMRNPVPKFKFRRLSRPINWDKFKKINVKR